MNSDLKHALIEAGKDIDAADGTASPLKKWVTPKVITSTDVADDTASKAVTAGADGGGFS